MSSYRRHIVDISELKPKKNYLFVEKKFFSGIKKREKNTGIPIINRSLFKKISFFSKFRQLAGSFLKEAKNLDVGK
jgi:hypothetical protein